MSNFWDTYNKAGILPVNGRAGWTVFGACDGPEPYFVGFVATREHADILCKSIVDDLEECCHEGDVQTCVARLTEDEALIVSNAYDVETPAQLDERIGMLDSARHQESLATAESLPLDWWLEWARKQFPESTAETCLIHLRREVDEALEAVRLGDEAAARTEAADVLALAYNAARHICGDGLGADMRAKLRVVRNRPYGEPDAEGVREHIRESGEPDGPPSSCSRQHQEGGGLRDGTNR